MLIVRKKDFDKNLYFEKQTHVKPLRKTLKQMRKTFPICDCFKPIIPNKKKRPCLNYDLKLCPAPCALKISQKDYNENVSNLISFLQGNSDELIKNWKEKMHEYSENLEYEKALRFRNQIKTLTSLSIEKEYEEIDFIDAVGFKESSNKLSLVILNIYNDKLVQKHEYFLNNELIVNIDEVIISGIKSHYLQNNYFPTMILFPKAIQDLDFFFEWLNDNSKKDVKFQILSTISKNKWVLKSAEEAKKSLNRNFRSKEKEDSAYKIIEKDIQDILKLKKPINLIECIDISTLQGSHTVGSIVSFKEGKPFKTYYRHYKITSFDKPNDVGSMLEVITRHFKRKKVDNLEFPDLLLVDGGKSQLSAISQAFNDLNVDVPFIGIAKKEEELIFPDKKDAILLPRDSRVLQLMVALRNEAHRFAITYNKNLRIKSISDNELEKIPGIGKIKRQNLLKAFKSIDNIKKASISDLKKVERISQKNAMDISNYFETSN